MSLENRLNDVMARIRTAAEECGRNPEDIKLIAVTKTYPTDAMNEAIRLGVTDIGENKPQEVRDKFDDVLPSTGISSDIYRPIRLNMLLTAVV